MLIISVRAACMKLTQLTPSSARERIESWLRPCGFQSIPSPWVEYRTCSFWQPTKMTIKTIKVNFRGEVSFHFRCFSRPSFRSDQVGRRTGRVAKVNLQSLQRLQRLCHPKLGEDGGAQHLFGVGRGCEPQTPNEERIPGWAAGTVRM